MAVWVPSFARLSVALTVLGAPAGCSTFGAGDDLPDAGSTAGDASAPNDAQADGDVLGDTSAPADADAFAEADAGCSTKCASRTCTSGVCDPAVFLTSVSFFGNLGGLDGADARCQDRADAANLPGTFKAWVSTAAQGPQTRFTKRTSSYRKVDGTVVATSFADLTGGLLKSPIDLTETGVPGNNVAWTATDATGAYAPANCNNWTEDAQGTGRAGLTTAIDGQWSLLGNSYGCSVSLALYCVEQ
jgi:hypothetical protein